MKKTNQFVRLTATKKVNVWGITLFQIELAVTCKWGAAGKKGGWVESEEHLSERSFASTDAQVFGNARVSGDALVFSDAQVSGDARVSGDALVFGNARVSGDARVSGNARVSGDALVFGDSWEVSPLQIQGTRHYVTNSKKGHLNIGCNCFTFEYWKEHYEGIGKMENYTPDQIKEYGLYIDLAIKLCPAV